MAVKDSSGVWKISAAVLAGAVVAGSSTWMATATDAARQQEITTALEANVTKNSNSIERLSENQQRQETQGARIETKLELVMQELQRVREAVEKLAR